MSGIHIYYYPFFVKLILLLWIVLLSESVLVYTLHSDLSRQSYASTKLYGGHTFQFKFCHKNLDIMKELKHIFRNAKQETQHKNARKKGRNPTQRGVLEPKLVAVMRLVLAKHQYFFHYIPKVFDFSRVAAAFYILFLLHIMLSSLNLHLTYLP